MKNKTYKGNQKLSKDAKLLDQYLSRYYNCIISKNDLLDRRKNILEDFNTPLTSVKFSGDPKAKKESRHGLRWKESNIIANHFESLGEICKDVKRQSGLSFRYFLEKFKVVNHDYEESIRLICLTYMSFNDMMFVINTVFKSRTIFCY